MTINEATKKALTDIENTLSKMQECVVDNNSASIVNIQDRVEKNWLVIKALFFLIVFGFFLGVAVAALLWHHFQLDEKRFDMLSQSVYIMQQRQEFLIDWQKSMQTEMITLHAEDIRHANKIINENKK
jgi:hypothetical protein